MILVILFKHSTRLIYNNNLDDTLTLGNILPNELNSFAKNINCCHINAQNTTT